MKAKVSKRATIILTEHECPHLIYYDMENRGNSEWEVFGLAVVSFWLTNLVL